MNVFVVLQNKKNPSILPCGLPPGTERGLDFSFPTLTDIFRLYKKQETFSTVPGSAPKSDKASRQRGQTSERLKAAPTENFQDLRGAYLPWRFR